MKLYILGEGKTEERLMKQVISKWFPDASAPEYRCGGGKSKLPQKVIDNLESELFLDQAYAVRCVILRDLDANEGESVESVQQEFTKALQEMFETHGYGQERVDFTPLPKRENILSYISTAPDLRVALHIAQNIPEIGLKFGSATTDDYILAAALIEGVAARFAEEAGLQDRDALIRKVLDEFPKMVRENMKRGNRDTNQDIDLEAKDLLGAYIAFSRFPEKHRVSERDTSAGIIVGRALKRAEGEARQVFASLYEAVEWVIGGKSG